MATTTTAEVQLEADPKSWLDWKLIVSTYPKLVTDQPAFAFPYHGLTTEKMPFMIGLRMGLTSIGGYDSAAIIAQPYFPGDVIEPVRPANKTTHYVDEERTPYKAVDLQNPILPTPTQIAAGDLATYMEAASGNADKMAFMLKPAGLLDRQIVNSYNQQGQVVKKTYYRWFPFKTPEELDLALSGYATALSLFGADPKQHIIYVYREGRFYTV